MSIERQGALGHVSSCRVTERDGKETEFKAVTTVSLLAPTVDELAAAEKAAAKPAKKAPRNA